MTGLLLFRKFYIDSIAPRLAKTLRLSRSAVTVRGDGAIVVAAGSRWETVGRWEVAS